MAGKPKRRAMVQELERRTRARFDELEGSDRNVLDYVCDWVESGGTLIALALEVSNALGFPVGVPSITNYLRTGWPDSETRLQEARVRASHILADQSLSLVDQEAETIVEATKQRDRSKARQWLAERWNAQQYGSNKGATVSISIGSLHLDALRARQAAIPLPAKPAAHVTMLPASNTDLAPVQDAEVVEV